MKYVIREKLDIDLVHNLVKNSVRNDLVFADEFGINCDLVFVGDFLCQQRLSFADEFWISSDLVSLMIFWVSIDLVFVDDLLCQQ